MKKLIYIFIITLISIGCKKNSFLDEQLIKTGWVLTDILDENDIIIYENIDSTNRDIYLIFTSDFEIIGHTPSIRIKGTFENDNKGSIKFSKVSVPFVSLKYVWEETFLYNYDKIIRYEIIDNKMYIELTNMNKLIFKRG